MAAPLIKLPGARYSCLPPGLHWLGFAEIRQLFGFNQHRLLLIGGFTRACHHLRSAGCRLLFLGGSFVTSKEFPSDYDGTWDPTGVLSSHIDPIFYDSNLIDEQKSQYLGELYVGGVKSEMYEHFSKDKITGERRGMVGIKLNLREISEQ